MSLEDALKLRAGGSVGYTKPGASKEEAYLVSQVWQNAERTDVRMVVCGLAKDVWIDALQSCFRLADPGPLHPKPERKRSPRKLPDPKPGEWVQQEFL